MGGFFSSIAGLPAHVLAALGLGSSTPAPASGTTPGLQQYQQAYQQAKASGNLPAPSTSGSSSGLPPGLMPQQGGLSGFLSNPLTQGALGAYLGTISQPRGAGLSRALAAGGLEGLGAYNQARNTQLLPYLMAANLMKSQAQTGLAQATTGLRTAQATRLQPNPQLAQHFQVLAQDPGTSPAAKQIYSMLAEGVANGTIDGTKAAQVAANEDINGAKALLIKAQTGEAQAGIGQKQAETALAQGKAGEIPAEEARLAAQTKEANTGAARNAAQAAAVPADTATKSASAAANVSKAETEQQKQYDAEENAAWNARESGKGVVARGEDFVSGGESRADFNKAYEAAHPRPAGAPSGATDEIVGPDGAVWGHMVGGKPVWLPGKTPPSTGAAPAAGG